MICNDLVNFNFFLPLHIASGCVFKFGSKFSKLRFPYFWILFSVILSHRFVPKFIRNHAQYETLSIFLIFFSPILLRFYILKIQIKIWIKFFIFKKKKLPNEFFRKISCNSETGKTKTGKDFVMEIKSANVILPFFDWSILFLKPVNMCLKKWKMKK